MLREVRVGRVVEREAQAAGAAGGVGSGGGSRASARSRSPVAASQASASSRPAGVGQGEQVDPALAMVEGDEPVAQQERGVGERRASATRSPHSALSS